MRFLSAFGNIFSGKEKKAKKEMDDALAYSVLVRTAETDIRDAGPVLSANCLIIHDITMVCTSLSEARSGNQMIDIIGCEIKKYPLKTFQQMMANFTEKTKHIDERYRRLLLKKIHEQIFETQHQIVMLYDKREYAEFISSPGKKSSDYWNMVLEACRARAAKDDPTMLFLKFLLAGFRMFVLKEPAHPVGTPFPGGYEVEKDYTDYYCPVRDKADDILYSICPYCPAKQSPEFMLLYTKKQREKKRKEGNIQNYFTNFKG